MPELPEVETVVRTLRPRLTGRSISVVHVHRADILQPSDVDLGHHLINRRIESITRRGKKIVITLDNAHRFYIHLGMTGQLTVDPPEAPHRPHTHLVISLDSPPPLELRFRDPRRFGGVWWLGPSGDPAENLGPEPLTLRPSQLAATLAKTKRPIKSALLDQSVIAGLGNIYVDESLFASGIHPLTPAHRLTTEQVGRLNRAIKKVLRSAIRHRGSTLRDYLDGEGKAGGFQSRHAVYDREGKPCRKCKTAIERIVLSGRSTHFCPKCQKRSGTLLPSKNHQLPNS